MDRSQQDQQATTQNAVSDGPAAGAGAARQSDIKPLLNEWVREATEEYTGIFAFFKQRRAILERPRLALQPLKIKPLKFAVYATILPSLIFGALLHVVSTFSVLPPSRLEREIEAIKTARDRCDAAIKNRKDVNGDDIKDLPQEIKFQMRYFDPGLVKTGLDDRLSQMNAALRTEPIADGFNELAVPLSAVLIAILFTVFMREFRAEYPAVREAGRAYLYYASARLTMPALIGPLCLSILQFWGRFANIDNQTQDTATRLIMAAWVAWGAFVLVQVSRKELRHILGMEQGSAAGKKWAIWWALMRASAITGVVIAGISWTINLAALFFFWSRAQ